MRNLVLLIVTLVVVATSSFAQEKAIQFSGNLNFEGSGGDYITGDKAYAFTAETGTFSVALSQDRRTLVVNYEDSKNWFHVEFQAILGYTLRTGKYKSASRYPFNSNDVDYEDGDVPTKITNRNGFNISGNGRGCNQLTADFEIKKIEVSEADGQILNFEANFVQHCENGAAYALGTILLNRNQNAEVKIQLN